MITLIRRDPWLWALATWLACRAYTLRAALLVGLGLGLVELVRALPARGRDVLGLGLIVLAVSQVLYQVLQVQGIDPWWPGRPYTDGRLPGTLGDAAWLGAALAIIGPLAPWALAPIVALGIWWTQAKVALVAFGAALAWRWRPRRRASVAPLLYGVLSLAAGLGLFATRSHDSWHIRRAVWSLGARVWLTEHPLIGHGLGSWWARVPLEQARADVYPREQFRQAHSEPLQVAFETGLVGLALVAGWLWAHRRAFLGAAGGALLALGLVSLSLSPVRIVPLAVVALLVIGLATADPTVERAPC